MIQYSNTVWMLVLPHNMIIPEHDVLKFVMKIRIYAAKLLNNLLRL